MIPYRIPKITIEDLEFRKEMYQNQIDSCELIKGTKEGKRRITKAQIEIDRINRQIERLKNRKKV